MPGSTATRVRQPATNAARTMPEETTANSHGTALAEAPGLNAQLWEDCLADQQYILTLQQRITVLQEREIRLRQEILELRANAAAGGEGL